MKNIINKKNLKAKENNINIYLYSNYFTIKDLIESLF